MKYWSQKMVCGLLCLTLSQVGFGKVNVWAAMLMVKTDVNMAFLSGNVGTKVHNLRKNGLRQDQGPVKHKVQKGETLYAISRKYQVSIQQIQSWNNLSGEGIQIGEILIVSDPHQNQAPAATEVPEGNKAVFEETTVKGTIDKGTAIQPKEIVSQVKQTDTVETSTSKSQDRIVHTVQSGETLFGVSRKYGVDVAQIKKLNKLTDTEIQIGQKLVINEDIEVAKVVTPPNPNQAKSFGAMLDEATGEESTQAKEMKVLTARNSPANLPPDAVVENYKDDYSGDSYKRVEEHGKAGLIEDFSTDQTKFYAFHKYLPSGSYIRVDYPEKSQSILVEVINSLPMEDIHAILLTAKCMDYLRMNGAGGEVTLRYVVPENK